jgi:hypothetical protein
MTDLLRKARVEPRTAVLKTLPFQASLLPTPVEPNSATSLSGWPRELWALYKTLRRETKFFVSRFSRRNGRGLIYDTMEKNSKEYTWLSQHHGSFFLTEHQR